MRTPAPGCCTDGVPSELITDRTLIDRSTLMGIYLLSVELGRCRPRPVVTRVRETLIGAAVRGRAAEKISLANIDRYTRFAFQPFIGHQTQRSRAHASVNREHADE